MNEEKNNSLMHQARIRHLACAALRRASNAGIPDAYMRIGKQTFSGLLSKSYYSKQGISIENVTNHIYDKPESLLKKPFILIDGGTKEERKKAGFAIFFRLITCDKFGLQEDCTSLIHKLQNMNMVHGMTREERADLFKTQDIVFLCDFHTSPIKSYSEGCLYMDEILEHRYNYRKPTLISFYTPLTALNASMNDSGLYGVYMQSFVDDAANEQYETETTIRIHVGID